MKLISALAVCTVFVAADAQAQVVNLSGRWQCVAFCRGLPGSFAFITQNGTELNVVNDAGEPSRAWVEYPGHIWVDRAEQGAMYSPDGATLQFDLGSTWQRAPELRPLSRDVSPPPVQTASKRRVAAAADRSPARVTVQQRSYLDAGNEVLPGQRKFTDYAYPPGYSATAVIDYTSGNIYGPRFGILNPYGWSGQSGW